jgi:PucR C-terminal helix-turn-helix domain/GGDEF-like domain
VAPQTAKSGAYPEASGAAAIVAGLRQRQGEIEEAILARVRSIAPDTATGHDAEYVEGLRAAVAAAIDYILTGLERGPPASASAPPEALAQVHRAARRGVGLDAVLRRYIAGHALLWDYVMEEAGRVGQDGALREMSRAQAMLLDELLTGVTRGHVEELARAVSSREQQLSEQVRTLLAGEYLERSELGYDLEGLHLGMIARGAAAPDVLRDLALRLNRRLLSVAQGRDTVWAWLGGQRDFEMSDLMRVNCNQALGRDVLLAVGEPARGLEGWRLTHQQAQATLAVALRRPRRLTRYADVALLASAVKDEALARALTESYLSPLERSRDRGLVWRETLRAYLAAERNASSAAAKLKVSRSTVEKRLRAIEERLGRTLHPCPAELEVALSLEQLLAPTTPEVLIAG